MSTEARNPGLRWEKLHAISTLMLAVIGAAALIFAWLQIKESRNAAQVQHIDDLAHRWDYEMVGTRKALALRRLNTKQDALLPLALENPPDEMLSILNFYEHMDLLIDRGFVDKYDVWRDFSGDMFPFYADVHSYIDSVQKDDHSTWKGFTDLMEDMRKEEKESAEGVNDHPDAKAILEFYQGDATLQPGIPAPRERSKKPRK